MNDLLVPSGHTQLQCQHPHHHFHHRQGGDSTRKKLSSSSFVDEGSLRPKGQRSSLVPDTLMIAQLSTPQSTSVINCHLIMIQTHMKIQKTNTHIYLFYLFEPKYLKFKYHYFKIKIRLKATTIKQCI